MTAITGNTYPVRRGGMTETKQQLDERIAAHIRSLQKTIDRMNAMRWKDDTSYFDGTFGEEIAFARQVIDGLNVFVVRRRQLGRVGVMELSHDDL